MAPSHALSRFVAALAPELRGQATDALQRLFDEKLAVAAPWAGDDVESFATYAGERMPRDAPLAESLEALRAEDLAFAYALAHGRPRALEEFERDYVPSLIAAVRKGVPGVDPADAVQEIRIAMLVGDGDGPARIREYRGAGALKAWLRVATLRRSLNRVTRSSKETPVEDAFFEALVGTVDTSHGNLFSSRDLDAVKEALRHAVGALSNREKGLLQYAFIDGATMEDIGATYGAHRSTIARWLELARDRVKREVETYLRDRLGLSPSEAQSLVLHTMTAVDSTVGRLLVAR